MLHVQIANTSLTLNKSGRSDNNNEDDHDWFLENDEAEDDFSSDDKDNTLPLAIPLTNPELDYLVNCTRCANYGGKNFKFRVEKYIKDGTTIIGVKCKKCGRVKTMEKKINPTEGL